MGMTCQDHCKGGVADLVHLLRKVGQQDAFFRKRGCDRMVTVDREAYNLQAGSRNQLIFILQPAAAC